MQRAAWPRPTTPQRLKPRPPNLGHKEHALLWDTSAKCGGAPWSNFQYDGRTLSLLLSTHFERRPESGLRPRCEVATCYSKPWNVAGGSFKLAFFQTHSCRNMDSKAPAMVSNPDTTPTSLRFVSGCFCPAPCARHAQVDANLSKQEQWPPWNSEGKARSFNFDSK